MFMFRKKDVKVSTTDGLHQEAKRFQEAIAEINANYKPDQIDIDLINGVASKFEIDAEFVMDSFESYLKNNALSAIRRVKAGSDYTFFDLEQAAGKFGFELDDLQVTFFSEE